MNYHIISYVLARLLFMEAGLLSFPLIVALINKEGSANIFAYLFTIGLLMLLGLLFKEKKPPSRSFYMREAFVIVALGWIALSFFGSLPFYISGEIPSLIDAFFETASGFTTTGSSILENVEALSKSLLFWRSFTHMVGGMGILIFALAVLPKLASEGVRVAKVESTGPSFGKLVSRLSMSAKILYSIYLAMTVLVIVLLLLGGMNLFDALIHGFGAAGTGGFSNKALSVGFYNSKYIETVLGISMLVFGINFNLHYLLLLGRWKEVAKNEELRWYLAMVLLATIFIALSIGDIYGIKESLRHSFFAVSSIVTSTGYATVDFSLWPAISRLLIMFLMLVGGMAGSTAGGLKVSRLIILVKSGLAQLVRTKQPSRVYPLRSQGQAVEDDQALAILNYFVIYLLALFILVVAFTIDLGELESALSAGLTTLSNIGPGLGSLGPASSFASLSNFSKLLMSLGMIAGRLEILPIIILFMPSTWKRIL